MAITAQTDVAQTSPQPRTRRVPAQGRPRETSTQQAVSGILDTTTNSSAFLRTAGFRLSPQDVSVPASVLKQYGLRPGDHINGIARSAPSSAPGRGSQPQGRAQHRVLASGTRRDDLLMAPGEYAAVGTLRRGLAGLDAQQGRELLPERTRDMSSNAEFLRQFQGTEACARR